MSLIIFWGKLIRLYEIRKLYIEVWRFFSMETLKPKNHVKFNSMVNLNVKENPPENNVTTQVLPSKEENTSPTSSSNSLEPLKGTLKKRNSFYKKLKNMIIPKSVKSTEHQSENEKTADINVVKKESKKKLWKNVKAKVAVAS